MPFYGGMSNNLLETGGKVEEDDRSQKRLYDLLGQRCANDEAPVEGIGFFHAAKTKMVLRVPALWMSGMNRS